MIAMQSICLYTVGVALSNGGTVHFDFEDLVNHAEHSGYVDVPVSGVALASSVNMPIHFPGDDDMADAYFFICISSP